MASAIFTVLLLVAVVSRGYASVTEITLPDESVSFISHPFYSRSITIPKWWFDTLETCEVTYPNGITYEAFPNNNIPDNEVVYMTATPPFNSCAVAFRHSERIENFAGTYELTSLVSHQDDTFTLTRQRFHVSITLSEVGIPK